MGQSGDNLNYSTIIKQYGINCVHVYWNTPSTVNILLCKYLHSKLLLLLNIVFFVQYFAGRFPTNIMFLSFYIHIANRM